MNYIVLIKILHIALSVSKKELADMTVDHEKLKQMYGKLKAENEEAKAACNTLSVAMTRFDEERIELIAKESSRQTEFFGLKSSLQKSYDDNDRMRQSLQDIESLQSQLVSQDVVVSYMESISNLKADYKTLENTHKNMIQRYADIKGAVEDAYVKFEMKEGDGTVSFAADIDEVMRAAPMLIINNMAERGRSPRVVIEALLDHINDLRHSGGGGMMRTKVATTYGDSRAAATTKEDGVSIDDSKFQSAWTHFEGIGFDPSIPVYLRASGKIQNILLSKRDTEMIINDIWIARESGNIAASGKPLGQNIRFEDFFYKYIQDRFKESNKITEFAYNFVDALKKFHRDSDCRLFSLVLNGDISEEVRHDQIAMLVNLMDELKKEESMGRIDGVTGAISLETFLRIVKKMFLNKGEQSMQRLERVLLFETGGGKVIQYAKLLEEDENGNQGKFCELLRAQHLTECVSFTESVMESLDQYKDGQENITIGRLREALEFSDPNKVRAEINRLLARGTSSSVEDVLIMEAKDVQVNVESFKAKLKNGLLKKSNPVVKWT